MENSLFGMGRTDTVLATNWSPAFSYFIYIYLTPPIVQFSCIKIDDIVGEIVQPFATYIIAFLYLE